MTVLTELIPYQSELKVVTEDGEVIDESSGKKHNGMLVEGIFGRVGTVNRNKRKYPRAVMERELNRKLEDLKANRVYGELDHPLDGKSKLQNSAAIHQAWEIDEEGFIQGRSLILNTSKGRDLQEIVRAGGRVGISQRGEGTMTHQFGDSRRSDGDHFVVNEDYKLNTFDFVTSQSVPDAEIQKIMEQQNQQGSEPMKITTLDELRTSEPDLYASMLEKAKEEVLPELEKALTAKVKEELDARLTKAEDEGDEGDEGDGATFDESELKVIEAALSENKRMQAVLLGIGSVLQDLGLMPSTEETGDEKSDSKVEARLASLETVVTEQAETTKEVVETIDVAAMKKHIDERLADEPLAEFLVETLDGCSTPEEVDERIEQEKKRLAKFAEKVNDGPRGALFDDTDGDGDGNEITESQKRQQDLAGV